MKTVGLDRPTSVIWSVATAWRHYARRRAAQNDRRRASASDGTRSGWGFLDDIFKRACGCSRPMPRTLVVARGRHVRPAPRRRRLSVAGPVRAACWCGWRSRGSSLRTGALTHVTRDHSFVQDWSWRPAAAASPASIRLANVVTTPRAVGARS